MMATVDDKLDRPTIADLEIYGLPVRQINALEEKLGFLYVDQIVGVSRRTLRSRCYGPGSGFGPFGMHLLTEALRNFRRRQPVKTVQECVAFRGARG